MIWHSSDVNSVIKELGVNDKNGLNNAEVDERLEIYGRNIISKLEKKSFLSLFLSQLKSKMVIFLLIVAVVSFVLSLIYEPANAFSAILIIAIVIINALVSSYQLYSCNNTLENIKTSSNPVAIVLREGVLRNVDASDLVPGDIIMLEAGDLVPADARIIESNEFRVNEALLTGIEVPTEKNENLILDEITVLENRANMVFSGTSVAHGSAKAIVTATGLATEVGKTNAILEQTGQNKLPFETQLQGISHLINIIVLAVCGLIFLISVIQNFSAQNFADMTVSMLLNAVVLAVAAVPEGLPAITTIVIAIGIKQMLSDKILVKDASAAELLGKSDVICCDKTGVLTRNKMVVAKTFDGKRLIDLREEAIDENAALLIKVAAACSTLSNDSTEFAIQNTCLAYNSMSKADIDAFFPHIAEIPFDSDRKTMSVITMINEKAFAIVKGAPESVIPNCRGNNAELLLKVNDALANEAFRVVAIAMRPLDGIPANPSAEDIEQDLSFVGLIALDDPPRAGVVEEIKALDKAGIKTIMITGDNPVTASVIARRIGILKDNTEVITGAELNEISDEDLAQNIEKYSVYARVSPQDKVRIVKAWQDNGKIVTITGDSLHDADALALADVGCAIGKFGADVAKGNADIIISNNRFDSVVKAIKESRGLFSNIKKSVFYLFGCNVSELLAMLVCTLIFKSPIVSAAQLLWINLLTDSAPAISLSMEKAEEGVMESYANTKIRKIFTPKTLIFLSIQSVYLAVMALIAFSLGKDFGDYSNAMTMTFVTMSLSQMFHVLNNKFASTLIGKKIFTNNFMNISLLTGLIIVLFLVFTPAGAVFGLTSLSFVSFLVCLALAISIIPFTEIIKFIMRRINLE